MLDLYSQSHPWEDEVAEVPVAYAPQVVVDLLGEGYNFGPLSVTGNMVLGNPRTALFTVGKVGHIRLVQDDVGGWNVTYGDAWDPVYSNVVNTAARATTIIYYNVVTPHLIQYFCDFPVGPFEYVATIDATTPLVPPVSAIGWEKNVSLIPPPAEAFATATQWQTFEYYAMQLMQVSCTARVWFVSATTSSSDAVVVNPAQCAAIATSGIAAWLYAGAYGTAGAKALGNPIVQVTIPAASVTATARLATLTPVHQALGLAIASNVGYNTPSSAGKPVVGVHGTAGALPMDVTNIVYAYPASVIINAAAAVVQAGPGATPLEAAASAASGSAIFSRSAALSEVAATAASAAVLVNKGTPALSEAAASATINSSLSYSRGGGAVYATATAVPLAVVAVSQDSTLATCPVASAPVAG